MRTTKHREEILAALAHTGNAMSAQELHAKLPHINLVTIYRNLETFSKKGALKKMYLDGGEARFEYQDHPHHHAVCRSCNKIIHFSIPEASLLALTNIPGFTGDLPELTVFGVCNQTSCQLKK